MAGRQSTAFTARETELLTIAFQCIKEKPVVRLLLWSLRELWLTEQ